MSPDTAAALAGIGRPQQPQAQAVGGPQLDAAAVVAGESLPGPGPYNFLPQGPQAVGGAQLDNLDGLPGVHAMPDGTVMPGPAHPLTPAPRPAATMPAQPEELAPSPGPVGPGRFLPGQTSGPPQYQADETVTLQPTEEDYILSRLDGNKWGNGPLTMSGPRRSQFDGPVPISGELPRHIAAGRIELDAPFDPSRTVPQVPGYEPIADEPRNWQSRDGSHSLEGGKLVGMDMGGNAIIQRPDGNAVKVHVSKLSGRDAAYVVGMSPAHMAGKFPLGDPADVEVARQETRAAAAGPGDEQYQSDLDAKTAEFRRQRKAGLPVRDVTVDDVNAVAAARAAQANQDQAEATAGRQRDEAQARQARAQIEKFGADPQTATEPQRFARFERAEAEDRQAADMTDQVVMVRRLAKRMGVPTEQAWEMYKDGLGDKEVNKQTRREAMLPLVFAADDKRNAEEAARKERLLNQNTLAGRDPRKNAANAYTAMDERGRQLALSRQAGVDPSVRADMHRSDQETVQENVRADASRYGADAETTRENMRSGDRRYDTDARSKSDADKNAIARDGLALERDRLTQEMAIKQKELDELVRSNTENAKIAADKAKAELARLDLELQENARKQKSLDLEDEARATGIAAQKQDMGRKAGDAAAEAEADRVSVLDNSINAHGMFASKDKSDQQKARRTEAVAQIARGDFSSPYVQDEIDKVLARIAAQDNTWVSGDPYAFNEQERVDAERVLESLGVPKPTWAGYLDNYRQYATTTKELKDNRRAARAPRPKQ